MTVQKSVRKVNIIVVRNGERLGYIKAISEKTGKFRLTKDKKHAKGYKSKDAVHHDIDFLSKYNTGCYIFIYE